MSYSYSRLKTLSVNELIEFILKIDNGFFDGELDTSEQYNKLEKYRYEAINILCNRYHRHYSMTKTPDDSLDSAYKLYLKYYI